MKKVIVFLLFFIMPVVVLAEGINNYYINATVLENGNLEVIEYFELTGSYNGFERIIDYKNSMALEFDANAEAYGGSNLHNGTGIEIKEVRGINYVDEVNFEVMDGDLFEEVTSASKGDYGVYSTENTSVGTKVRIFLPSSYSKAFYIKYELKDMAILHDDIGELGWNIVGNEFHEYVRNFVAIIKVLNNKDDIRVWAHGPLSGESEIIDKQTVKIAINDLYANTAIDVRLAFDKEAVGSALKKSNVTALEKIISYETIEAEKANKERERAKENYINNIENRFNILDVETSRLNYDELYDLIVCLEDEELISQYLNRLVTYKNKVDTYEYHHFTSDIYNINKFKEYYFYYNNALNLINNVFDEELKNKMIKELQEASIIIKQRERRTEFRLIIISLLTVGIAIYVYYFSKFKQRKIKAKVEPMYIREIPSNLFPECAGLIIDSKITGNEVTATLLDLIRRKIVTYVKLDNGSYELKYDNKTEQITEFDKVFIKMIFGNKISVNSKKIKKIKYTEFFKWKKQTIRTLEDNNLIEKYDVKQDTANNTWVTVGLFLLFTPLLFLSPIFFMVASIKKYRMLFLVRILIYFNIILCSYSLIVNYYYHYSIIMCLMAIIIINYVVNKIPMKIKLKKTKEGIEEANKWNGLRNFLIDFSAMDDKTIPEVSLWEEYLVYATAFGIGKEVLKAMKVKIENEKLQVDLDNYVMVKNMNDISRIAASLDRVGTSAIKLANSKTYVSSSGYSSSSHSFGSHSSSSGHGGGFSGGSSHGGSFGGGGGGSRF